MLQNVTSYYTAYRRSLWFLCSHIMRNLPWVQPSCKPRCTCIHSRESTSKLCLLHAL